MKATIVNREQMILVGFSFFGDPFTTSGDWTLENEIGRLWNRFINFTTQGENRIRHVVNPGVAYEVHVWNEETAEKGHFEVFVGVEVAQLEDVPVELLVKVLPATQYAVFTLQGEQIVSDWSRPIHHEWMPASNYENAYPFMFQYYDQRFKGLDQLEGSQLDVYIPIKEREKPA